jgi:SAM-dependent methyltransferase
MAADAISTPYGRAFHQQLGSGSLRSARVIVPELLRRLPVHSVVDFGCGVGNWLRAFQENGVTDIQGFDGDYVDTRDLQIEPAHFKAVDLSETFEVPRTFDLAMSLEVAEHLPEARAESFIATLTRAAPAVLFGAAIPGQGGVHHINEQWPDYWRALFAARDFWPVDLIRPVVWGRSEVEPWYQQNTLLYCARSFLDAHPDFTPVRPEISLNIVHPVLYDERRGMYFTKALRLLPALAWQAAVRRFAK